ncbi:glycoside hydrolase family 20 zincin-like fold domain-containing protein [uncultured Algibacter sp.]|uniref:glycoside hydrolase family 20 zincin-like fold domain-containing protein n=1 Tax=uncultured Algibacter sp. TaxID=298659 RepID=UPI003216BC34
MKNNFIILFLLVCPVFGITQNIVPLPKSVTVNTGTTTIDSNTTIYYDNDTYQGIANLLKEELFSSYGINVSVSQGSTANTGDILIKQTSGLKEEQYKLTINDNITLEVSGIGGAFPGTVSIVQSISNTSTGVGSAKNATINDEPFRAFRATMIDVKNFWYSTDQIKSFIKLARFYKIRYLALHTGEKQWIGALLSQTTNFTAEQRATHRLYTKAEMDDLIQFGKKNGVYLFPHNECTPNFSHMKEAMQEDFNPSDSFAGYADEIDGNGTFSSFDGNEDNARFRTVIAEAHRRAIDQFKAGYPSGLEIPMYHIGPVQSEGGMSDNLANYFRGVLVAKDPKIKMSYWAGPNTSSSVLYQHRDQVIPVCYTKQFHPTFASHLQNGWTVVNAAWTPLYIVGNSIARPVEMVYNEWNYFRGGTDGIAGPVTYDEFSGVNDSNLMGGLLCTWENDANINLAYLSDRLPAFSEHAWHHKAWPYPTSDFTDYENRMSVTSDVASLFISNAEPPSAPISVAATDGVFSDKVRVTWRASNNGPREYQIFRNTSNTISSASLINTVTSSVTSYEDTTVSNGATYYYWVKAVNFFGESSFSTSNSGASGAGGGLALAHEAFDYSTNESIPNKNGGSGWGGQWRISSNNGSYTINDYGLTYPGLVTSGKSLKLKPSTDTPSLVIERETSGQLGAEGVSTWVSFLVRANKVANGHLALFLNNVFDLGLFKRWGTKLMNTAMQNDITYFVVYQFESGPGDDVARYWLNPGVNVIPSPSNIATQRLDRNLGTGNKIAINLQGYGQGEYDIDEIRVGSSFTDVMPTMTLSQDEISLKDDAAIAIYPNPFTSEFKIEVANENQYNKAVLLDISGRAVYQKTLKSKPYNLDNLSKIPAGTYILKLVGKQSDTKSFLVVHK